MKTQTVNSSTIRGFGTFERPFVFRDIQLVDGDIYTAHVKIMVLSQTTFREARVIEADICVQSFPTPGSGYVTVSNFYDSYSTEGPFSGTLSAVTTGVLRGEAIEGGYDSNSPGSSNGNANRWGWQLIQGESLTSSMNCNDMEVIFYFNGTSGEILMAYGSIVNDSYIGVPIIVQISNESIFNIYDNLYI